MSRSSNYFKATVKEFTLPRTYLEILAEFIGTILMMAFGMGGAQFWNKEPDRIQIGLCFGIAVGAAMTVVQHISGGHLNPAVTIAQTLFGRIYALKAILFIAVQCAGCICGAGIVRLAMPSYESNDGVMHINGITQAQGLVIEIVVGFIMMMIWEASTDPGRPDMYPGGPSNIGFAIAACIISVIPWTGASLNPARSIGTAVVMDDYVDWWVYWIGPPVGAILGSVLYTFMYRVGIETDKEDLPSSTA